MPEWTAPGLFVAPDDARPPAITGVSTSVAAFIGMASVDPGLTLAPLASWEAFEAAYGGTAPLMVRGAAVPNYTAIAVMRFFAQGGTRLYVSRVADATVTAYAAALGRLDGIDEIAILAAPDAAQFDPAFVTEIHRLLIADAERTGRFAVLDTPAAADTDQVLATRAAVASDHAALYTPWLRVADPQDPGRMIAVPPSGAVCGVYAQTDTNPGVFKAPAGIAIAQATPVRAITKAEQDVLNPQGVNVIRIFAGRGTLVYGARSLSHDPQWRYVSTRRYLTYLEKALTAGLAWTVFEPNDAKLWARVRAAIEDFLLREWQKGGLIGTKPEHAYFVRCDAPVMTTDDAAAGRVIVVIGVAPIRPAEFIMIRVTARRG